MSGGPQLPFPNRMHDFYAGDRTPRRPEGLEAEHGTRQPFHGAMVLFDEVIDSPYAESCTDVGFT